MDNLEVSSRRKQQVYQEESMFDGSCLSGYYKHASLIN
jgi:hypothetical protein